MSPRSGIATALGTTARQVLVATGLGATLGLAAWFSDQLGWPLELAIPANTIGAWLGVAFAAGAAAAHAAKPTAGTSDSATGATVRAALLGAACGLVALVVAVIAYYVLVGALGEGIRSIGAVHAATVWGSVAVIAGPVMGAAGATWRRGRGWPRAIAAALLASALLAEGVAFGGARWLAWAGPADDPGAILFAMEAVAGILLPAILLDRGEWLRGYLSLAALAALGLVAIGPVIDLVRGLADRF